LVSWVSVACRKEIPLSEKGEKYTVSKEQHLPLYYFGILKIRQPQHTVYKEKIVRGSFIECL
jgi:hypothetical protein